MYINFPKYNTKDLQNLVNLTKSHSVPSIAEDMSTLRKLEQDLFVALAPLFDDELAFYEQLSDILKRSLMG